MKRKDAIPPKSVMSPKDPRNALPKARKAKDQAFLTYESELDESVVPNV